MATRAKSNSFLTRKVYSLKLKRAIGHLFFYPTTLTFKCAACNLLEMSIFERMLINSGYTGDGPLDKPAQTALKKTSNIKKFTRFLEGLSPESDEAGLEIVRLQAQKILALEKLSRQKLHLLLRDSSKIQLERYFAISANETIQRFGIEFPNEQQQEQYLIEAETAASQLLTTARAKRTTRNELFTARVILGIHLANMQRCIKI